MPQLLVHILEKHFADGMLITGKALISYIATTLAQPSFISYFSLDKISNTTQVQGAINGSFQTGGLLGALSCSHTADFFGRRTALLIGGTFALIGGALQAGSVHIAMFIVARLLTGLGIGRLRVYISS